jgi:hypothetical protein
MPELGVGLRPTPSLPWVSIHGESSRLLHARKTRAFAMTNCAHWFTLERPEYRVRFLGAILIQFLPLIQQGWVSDPPLLHTRKIRALAMAIKQKRDGLATVPDSELFNRAYETHPIRINNPFHHHQVASWGLYPSRVRR